MSEPGARQSTSDTAKDDHASEEWSALENVRCRLQFDLGQIRLPYIARLEFWKTWGNLGLLCFALLCLALVYLVFPGFSGAFEGSVLDVFRRWALTLAGFGGGVVTVIVVISNFFDYVVIELDRSWVTVYESSDKPTFREPLANYTGVSLRQDHILLENETGSIDKAYYLVDLDHSENTKTIPLCRGTLEKARERQEQACRVLRLPKVGGDFAVTSPEEMLTRADPLVAAAVDLFNRRKRGKQADGDQHGNEYGETMDAARTFEQGRRRRTLILGVLCAGLGAVVGFGISSDSVGQGWDRLTYYAAVAAALTSMPLWWLIMERRQRFGAVRGVLTGAVGGFLAHYPCWYLMILGQYVSYRYLKYFGSSTTEVPSDPFEALGGAFALSFWSWLLFGWLTAIIGAIAVGAYAWNINRRLRSDHLDRC